MKKLIAFLIAAILVAPIISIAHAEDFNVGEKQKIAEWNQRLLDVNTVETFKTDCGYNLPVTLDDNMVKPFMAVGSDAAVHCDSVRYILRNMCSDPVAKEAIAGKIKSLHCAYKEGETKGTFSRSLTGELTFTSDAEGDYIDDVTKEYVEKNL